MDCIYEDFPGVRAVLGERKFRKLSKAYLVRYPSRTFSLRDLGSRFERFIGELLREPEWADANLEALQIAREMARFEWAQIVAFDGPSAPPVTPDGVLGRSPSELTLDLQPYLTLLELRYAVDEFAVAIKKEEEARGQASQAMADSARKRPATARGKTPRREKIWLAVHRCDNMVYFKRLEPEAFAILKALRRGSTLEAACEKALLASKRKEEVDWAAKIGEWFALWAQLGWLTRRGEV